VRPTTHVVASCLVVSLALLITSAPATAAPKRITGELTKPGYTVIALAANGKARAVRASQGEFRLRPPASLVTLHLRALDGTYAGPIVVGRARKRAIVGIRAGAKLGEVKVSARRGYAKVSKQLPDKSLDRGQTAKAKNGVPIGAGVFGRVRSSLPREPIPADRDLDGIPDLLDIDDDGDLILDSLDRSTAVQATAFAAIFNPFTRLTLELPQTVNANATAATTQQIDAALSTFSDLLMGVLAGDSAELDCGGANQSPPRAEGLVYCSSGGTGSVFGSPFPGQSGGPLDPDGDGFGTLTPDPGGQFGGMTLHHGARTDQIRTGDVLIERVTTGGVETLFPAMLQYVFATVPALVAYNDGAGHSATVSYPASGQSTFTVAPRPAGAPAAGDVVLTLTYWRPQRSRIANDPQPQSGESGEWTDIGGLVYVAGIGHTGAFCPQEAFSDPRSDPVPNLLVPPTGPVHRPDAGGFSDLAVDHPASAANTLTYTLNVTRCLAAKGLPAWGSGETQALALSALGANTADEAQQQVSFKRE